MTKLRRTWMIKLSFAPYLFSFLNFCDCPGYSNTLVYHFSATYHECNIFTSLIFLSFFLAWSDWFNERVNITGYQVPNLFIRNITLLSLTFLFLFPLFPLQIKIKQINTSNKLTLRKQKKQTDSKVTLNMNLLWYKLLQWQA